MKQIIDRIIVLTVHLRSIEMRIKKKLETCFSVKFPLKKFKNTAFSRTYSLDGVKSVFSYVTGIFFVVINFIIMSIQVT
jgi:hypothetical protein